MTRRSPKPSTRAFLGAMLLFTALAVVGKARAQQSFTTPEAAANALVTAAKGDGRQELLTVLGRGAADIVSSGDEVADKSIRQRFIAAYDEKHQIALEGDRKAIMVIGNEDFPFPIPLIRGKDGWQFDAAAGREEILFRRVGGNELDTIQACLAYVDAQNEYAEKDRGAGKGVYAQQIVSDPGTKNGLYWPAAAGEEQSPLGELVAEAAAEGYRVKQGRDPYHGYYFRILTEQGAAAKGGAIDYVVRGKMIGGFALVAYPAEYGNSGVMTFIVNHAGIVYQRDLGPQTTRIAAQMSEFNPDENWKRADTD